MIELGLEDTLAFELRVDNIDTFDFTVCESLENSAFYPSMLLLGRIAPPIETCIQAFGSFSRPYIVEVSFRSNVTDPSVLTQRKIKTVLSGDCSSTEAASGTLIVVGK